MNVVGSIRYGYNQTTQPAPDMDPKKVAEILKRNQKAADTMSMTDTIATATTRENTINNAAQIWQAAETARKAAERAARLNSTLPYAPARKGFLARVFGR